MARAEFDRDLAQLESEIVLMSGLVESAVIDAVGALANRDLQRSQRVIDEDDRIDDKEQQVEVAAISLIRREAPMAVDLRRIMAALFVAGELERIGDYAEGIAKISLLMGHEPPLKELIDIPRMTDIALAMLKRSLEAFVQHEVSATRAIADTIGAMDDEVDVLYETVQTDLIELMKQDPDNIERATYLLWAAHNIERVADRSTNIAERAIYLVTGESVSVGDSETEDAHG